MFLHLGQSVMVPENVVLGIFDLDNTIWSHRTRHFLELAEQEGRLVTVGDDLPRSFVLCQEEDGPPTVYITQLNTATLLRRAESGGIYDL
jgi:extracellular matrix regulatory protein B